MNIQIFGKPKCFDTKKAERYFKERGIKCQYINLSEKAISKGEYRSIKTALHDDLYALIDDKSKEYEACYIKYLADEEDKEEKLLENQGMFKTPIVRNGKNATVGYQPDIWKNWKD